MNIAMSPVFSFGMQFNSDGKPLAGGLIYTYEAGSNSLLKQTYDNDTGTPVENENPIVLNSSGRLETSIWLETEQEYHFVLQDPTGAILESIDHVAGSVSQQYVQDVVDGLNTKFLPLTGGSVSGNLTVLGVTSLKSTNIVGTFSVSGASTMGTITATSVKALLDANNGRIINVNEPVDATDAATKAYADNAAGGSGVPVGSVFYTVSATAPVGYLIANGASLSRTEYPLLFEMCGTTYGAVDGDTFNIPDLRGYFMRGLDLGRGVDPGIPDFPARPLGSKQDDAIQNIIGYLGVDDRVLSGGGIGAFRATQATTDAAVQAGAPLIDTTAEGGDGRTCYAGFDASLSVGMRTSTETRPKNFAFTPIIRVG